MGRLYSDNSGGSSTTYKGGRVLSDWWKDIPATPKKEEPQTKGGTISAAPKLSWWDQHIVGGYKDLKKAIRPSEEDMLIKNPVAPSMEESKKKYTEARETMKAGNNDMIGSAVIQGITGGLIRPNSLGAVPLTKDEKIGSMAAQTLGAGAWGLIGGAPVLEGAGQVANAVEKIPLVGKYLKPGSNTLVNWVKSGVPSAAVNISAGQLGLDMDNKDSMERSKRALTDAGLSYAFHLLHLPTDIQESSAYKKAPSLEVSSPEHLDTATKHLVETGNTPVAQKDLGNGELGIVTKNEAGDTKLFKVVSSTDSPVPSPEPVSPINEPSTPKKGKSALAKREGVDIEYDKEVNKERVTKATDFFKTNRDEAVDIINQVKPERDGIRSDDLYVAASKVAEEEKDKALMMKIVNSGSLSATESGKRIAIYAEMDPDSLVSSAKRVQQGRQKIADMYDDSGLVLPGEKKRANQMEDLSMTDDEFNNLSTLQERVKNIKSKVDKEFNLKTPQDEDEFGASVAALRDYEAVLIDKSKKAVSTSQKIKRYSRDPLALVQDIASLMKPVKTVFDNGFYGRQGLKVALSGRPDIWAKSFVKSWSDIGKTVKGDYDLVRVANNAAIYSRKNYRNNFYNKAGLQLFSPEDVLENNLLHKVPLIERLAKAGEVAYDGSAKRLRADYFDGLITNAQKHGVEMTDANLKEFGELANAITGYGKLNSQSAKSLNIVMFSARKLKGDLDFLTAQGLLYNPKAWVNPTPAQKVAAGNLVKVVGSLSAMMATANALMPGSVETDPTSSNFGKIKIGDTRIDISGGMSPIATLAARIATGKKTSSVTGEKKEIAGDFGTSDQWDLFVNFMEGKASPIVSLIREQVTGKDFVGGDISKKDSLIGAFTPFPYSNYKDLASNPKAANLLIGMMADSLGFSTNTYDRGESKTGIDGIKASITSSLVDGDSAMARKIIDSNFPYTNPETGDIITKDEAMTSAAQSAAKYAKRNPEQTTDFFAVYSPVSKERTKVSNKVTSLIMSGDRNQARRVADEFNKTIEGQFKDFNGRYSNIDKDLKDRVKSLKIATDNQAFASRAKK